ncbi:MAG: cysteine--tRNA ligase [Actinobacteria bacterium]|uniref:Cysteine--tRNA ligase n=1 Tax=freshwater metagenome TaxID=449393 RepID=A0A6J7HHY4_9ZZZZ|nr:cysteine--tRNA ligase [Actinomycetota bacterium]MSX24255.1 cysteine--tRNA ligase [Actinomycetota bacterium]MSY46870.1 cysteine--tRNA ligase [Actinomycetota bacterium]MSY56686.1 cysteine--tRNA ligase [Actinomycetota bacterium]MTB00389.1 cysteine--tRNA ligase [Actinomycetota bacterium]
MSSLELYDTLTRTVSPFTPIKKGEVSIYLCGATVQAPPHIGHIRSGVNFDILSRWLTKSGYAVTFIRNVTDIDDKILQKSEIEKMPWWALAQKYERAFSKAYAALNVAPPTYEPRATGHITQMIELMSTLIARGAAYAPGNGDVYLEVRKLSSYLTLSRQKLDDLLSADDAEETFKKDPRDFALWKGAKPGEPSWPTPWGPGRPGWHLECSAMAHAYLGESFDIHGGGLDLIFPHHENEIAQSEGAGYSFAKRWMHNAWVTTSGEKMSKSLGNSLQVTELLKSVRGIELRWYLGSAHYRSMLEFSQAALDESATAFRRIESFLHRASETLGHLPKPTLSQEFTDAMNDDLAVPAALASISEALRLGNIALSAQDSTGIANNAGQIRGALEVLGCDPFDPAFASSESGDLTAALDGTIALALAQRAAARDRKDFAASDEIRDGLSALGITIEDTPQGPRWSISRIEER